MSVLCSWVVNLVVTFVHGLCGYFYFLLLFADRFVCFFHIFVCLCVCVCVVHVWSYVLVCSCLIVYINVRKRCIHVHHCICHLQVGACESCVRMSKHVWMMCVLWQC